MSQLTADLVMRRGDTPLWELAVVSRGLPFSLSGATIYFTAKENLDLADPGLFQLVTGAGILITDAAGGLAQIQPRREDTNHLLVDWQGFYDIQISFASTTFTVLSGTLTIIRDTTRAA